MTKTSGDDYSAGNRPADHCLVSLVEEADVAGHLNGVASGAPTDATRNLIRAVVTSRATWQAVVRAEHMYLTMQRIGPADQSLLCLYTSMLNRCAYCIDDCAGAALELGLRPRDLRILDDISCGDLEPRLVAYLSFARAVALTPGDIPDDVVTELRRYAGDEEVLEIAAIVSMKCFWNTFTSALRLPPEGRCSDTALFRDLCAIGARLHDVACSPKMDSQ